jgi:ankyrin repeat protein
MYGRKKESMSRLDRELRVAVQENNLPEVSRFLSSGADVNAKDSSGWTPLIWACCQGHVQVAKELLDHGADIEAKNRYGETPLHWASRNGHVRVFQALLDHGADIEAKDMYDWTPLHWACSYNDHLPVVKALVSSGANVLAANNFGELPIYFAVSRGKSEVSKYLLQHYYATTRRLPLHELLKDLTWIGDPYSSVAPPLRYAFHHNVLGTDDVVEILEFLVSQNPDSLTSRDRDGSVPLHVACRRGASFTIVQSLVNLYKASVKSVTPQGDLPLFLACEMPESSLDSIFF